MKVRLTPEEKLQIAHDAERCGIGVSTYVRQKSLGSRPRAKDTSLLKNQLAKLGGLLKHLHNEGLGHSNETAEILSLIKRKILGIEEGEADDRQSPEEA